MADEENCTDTEISFKFLDRAVSSEKKKLYSDTASAYDALFRYVNEIMIDGASGLLDEYLKEYMKRP